MAAFPDTLPPNEPYDWSPNFNTKLGGPFETPVHDARVTWPDAVMSAQLVFPKRATAASYLELYNFFVGRKGRGLTFTFFDFNNWQGSPVGIEWDHVYVGVRDGVATVYDLPFKNMTSRSFYKNGVVISSGITFNAGAGTDGRDSITFSTVGTPGDRIDATGVGRLAMKARFTSDGMPFSTFSATIVSKGLGIQQVY